MENFIKEAVPKFPQDELSECGAASGSLVWKFRVNDFYDWLKIRWMSRLWWPWATGAEVEVGGGGDLMLMTVYQLSVCAPASEHLSSLWFVGLFWLKWLSEYSLNPPGTRKNLHLIKICQTRRESAVCGQLCKYGRWHYRVKWTPAGRWKVWKPASTNRLTQCWIGLMPAQTKSQPCARTEGNILSQEDPRSYLWS